MAVVALSGEQTQPVTVLETAYGPAVRHRDWTAVNGTARPGGGALHLLGEPRCRIRRDDYPHGGGGDVRLSATLDIDHVREDPRLVVQFNTDKAMDPDVGFHVSLQDGSCRVMLAGETVGQADIDPLVPGSRYDVTLLTLDRQYRLTVGERAVAQGTMPPPYTANEGWTAVDVTNCDARLLAFTEDFVALHRPVPTWTRAELLYEETFTEASLRDNWIVNRGEGNAGVEVADGAFVFRHMCNGFLRRRFEGPLAMDCTVTPVPTEEFPSEVTDAIVIWMIDSPNADFFELIETRNRQQDAGLGGLMPLPFYWVDFGGTNNVTTRFRRNPHRHMIRQFTDPERLLERDRTYSLTVVQHGEVTEFHVDGQPWIRAFDSEPLTSGHVGFRAYCADLRVSSMRVWRLRQP